MTRRVLDNVMKDGHGHAVGHAHGLTVQRLVLVMIVGEGLFVAHGLELLVRLDRAGIDAPRQLGQVPPVRRPQGRNERVLGQVGDVADGANAESLEAIEGSRDAPPDPRTGA